MNIGDKVVIIGHTPKGGQQFDLNEEVEIVRIGSTPGSIKCTNGKESWWLFPSEYRLLDAQNDRSWVGRIQVLIGTATMCWNPRPIGVFDDVECSKVADKIIAEIDALLELKNPGND